MKKKFLTALIVFTSSTSCITNQVPFVSKDSNKTFSIRGHQSIFIKDDLLNIYSVNTPNTPLRTGPGTQYPIASDLLEGGEIFIKIKEIKDWLKVSSPTHETRGWLHKSQLEIRNPAGLWLETRVESLEKVFSRKKISRAIHPFSQEEIEATIPKDHTLYSLGSTEKSIIVIHESSNSLLKLSKEMLR